MLMTPEWSGGQPFEAVPDLSHETDLFETGPRQEQLVPIHLPAGLTSFACEADSPTRPIRPPALAGQSAASAGDRAPPAVAGGRLAGPRRSCLRSGPRRRSAGIPPARRGRR